MIRTTAIASGSNGNCYFYESEGESFLVDAGISCKALATRMKNLGLSLHRISGLFVTHEHSDHVRGIEMLSKQFKIPLYITQKTLEASNFRVNDRLVNVIDLDKSINLGNVTIHPFSKNHDAAEPCSYMLSSQGKNVSVITDIGEKCPNVIKHLSQSDLVFLESNYDDIMLQNGMYPPYLKQRIAGAYGHFSNYQAGLLVLEHARPRLKNVFLSHLSANNNTPQLALNTFNSLIKERTDLCIRIMMTSRDAETGILELE